MTVKMTERAIAINLVLIVFVLAMFLISARAENFQPPMLSYNEYSVTWKTYVDMKWAEQDRAMEMRVAAMDRSTTAAESASEKRLEDLERRISSLEISRAEIAGKASQDMVMFSFAFTGVLFIISLLWKRQPNARGT